MKKGTNDPLRKKMNLQIGKVINTQPENSASSRRIIYINDDVWRQLKLISFKNEKSVSKILEKASREYLDKL
jgi:hypothetical protein